MASAATFSLLFPSQKFTFVPALPFRSRRTSVRVLHRCSPNHATAATDQDILRFVAESDGKALPCVRTYENDLARLSLVGAVAFDQALTAAAADGGKAADDHLRDNVPVMVVETVFPGGSDPRATISTRLFLPTQKVKERARRLRKSFSEDMSAGSMSKNILAMTFRQVVMRQLWNFQLMLFGPGSERDLEDYENPREVSASFTLTSSDERVISVIAEVICISALQSTEKHFLDDYMGRNVFPFFNWLRKHKSIASRDSSVVLYHLFDDEIVEHAKQLLENFHSMKDGSKLAASRQMSSWWKLSVSSELEKIGGPGFSTWASEYLPIYRLDIDAGKLGDLKLEGWKKSTCNRWEVLLTHSQMVGLADTFDMYFEDIYSLPRKRLPCRSVANYADLSGKKRGFSLLKIVSITAASGILLVTISALAQFGLPHQNKGSKHLGEQQALSSEAESLAHQSLDTSELDSFCILVIKKLKDGFCWAGDITAEIGSGAWIGEVPDYLKISSKGNSVENGNVTSSAQLENLDEGAKASVQDIATYQVVLSSEGKVIGFQPTSRVGVNNWAANPLAKELYGGRKLSPGLIEPGLRSHPTEKVVVVELLMSVNSDSPFALARPLSQT